MPVLQHCDVPCLTLVHQVADGMCALAKKRVIHRDLAARNILLGNAGSALMVEAKICDFGLSRSVSSHATPTPSPPTRHADEHDEYLWEMGGVGSSLRHAQPP